MNLRPTHKCQADPLCLPTEVVQKVKQVGVAAVARSFQEVPCEQLRVTELKVRVSIEMEVHKEIDLVTHIATGSAIRTNPRWSACCIVKEVPSIHQGKVMVLGNEHNPIIGVECKLGVQVVDILTSDHINKAHVVMAEREQLVKRAMGVAIVSDSASACDVVADPDLRTPCHILELVPHSRCQGIGTMVLVNELPKLEHPFHIVKQWPLIACGTRTERVDHVPPTSAISANDSAVGIDVIAIQTEVIEIKELSFVRSVLRPHAPELHILIGCVGSVEVH